MKEYLSNLNERDKWALIGGGSCLALYLYYVLMYLPLSNRVEKAAQQLTEKRQTLAWIQQVKAQGLSNKKKQSLDKGQLLSMLSEVLQKDPQLKFPYSLEQTGSGDISLSFEAVPFTNVMSWLAKLNDDYKFTIKHWATTRGKTPGVVQMMIVLSPG